MFGVNDLTHSFLRLVSLINQDGIPAGLYALGDVITYINLRSFDPATLLLLSEMKVVVTAMVHQCLFKRMLRPLHWASLGLVSLGCMIKALDSVDVSHASDDDDSDGDDDTGWGDTEVTMRILLENEPPTVFNYFLVLVYIMTSTMASVYNEKLLKDKQVSINLQNIFLYVDGMVFLMIGIAAGLSEQSESIYEALSPSGLKALFAEPSVLAMACTMAIAGVVTSRFLKVFDSIQKSVATALVIVSLPFLSRLFFGMGITMKMIVSLIMVVLGMYCYTTQPSPETDATDDGMDNESSNNVEFADQLVI